MANHIDFELRNFPVDKIATVSVEFPVNDPLNLACLLMCASTASLSGTRPLPKG
ncbi:hypothetical protein FA13DRAFT_1736787 [Coprinellus micaceus]|uniref:Uncharacterized protein n=1 Tax=Coprinellus micaceus TaxID=71717 RepID=A0A4Y7SYT8_COPMI|nr:hypothetical protein FA13DRAFT_1736787 [Coprinellus micaceus]